MVWYGDPDGLVPSERRTVIGEFCILFQGNARKGLRTEADVGDEDPDSHVAKGLDAGHGPVDMRVAQWRVRDDTVSVRRAFIVGHIPGRLLSLRARASDLFVHIVSPRTARCGIGWVVGRTIAAVSMRVSPEAQKYLGQTYFIGVKGPTSPPPRPPPLPRPGRVNGRKPFAAGPACR